VTGPFAGVTVLELIQKGPGAYVTMMLADMGADIIKVETPSRGRESGSGGSAGQGDAKLQVANLANRGKRSIVLDLKHPDGRAVLAELAKRADVLVEGFRPGVTARLGADYASLSALNSRLIYCSLSGYGQDGPYRDLPGHDVNYIAIAGILSLVGEKGGPPIVPPNLIADFGGAALHAVAGISMALFAREKNGRGQHVELVLDVGDLLIHLILGGGDPGNRDAIFVERIGDPLHLQLRPVKIDCLHRDADLEMAGLDLGGLGVGEFEVVGRCSLFAVWPLADDRCRSERRQIDALDAGSGNLRAARAGD